MWTGLPVCCPGGANDGSQAIYCLERVQSRIRPVDTVLEVKGFWE
jgi:hypothetical protein